MGVPSGMPRIRTSKLRYCANYQMSCTAVNVGWVDMRANSVFDPDYSTGGQQPMGYDQWAALFNQYVVVGSKLTAYITYQDQRESAPPMCVGVYLSDDASVPYQDWRGFVEAKKGNFRNMTALQKSATKVVSKFSAKKFFNIKDPLDNILRIGADVASNPSEGALWVIWGSVTGATTPTEVVKLNVNIVIDFIVKWSEPKDLSRS